MAAVAHDYATRPDRAIVIAPDAIERRELNQLIRENLQAQGKVAAESRSVPVLIEQRIGNSRVATNYSPGDQVHYRTGSPELHGLPHNGSVTIFSVDSKRNTLAVETNAGERIIYDPSQLRVQTAQSKIYREETREFAVGDRIRLAAPDRQQRIGLGEFATVEHIKRDNSISARLDNGRAVELNPNKVKHIEYGYTVGAGQRISADLVLVTGEILDLKALASMPKAAHEIAVYTSDASSSQRQQADTPTSKFAQKETPSIQQRSKGYGLGLGL